jgi:hypothetical protein
MNDNERIPSLGKDIFDIIESFAPGYSDSLRCYESTKIELIRVKISFLFILLACFIYALLRASPINSATFMTIGVTATSVYGLWRVDCLEREIGIWKWGYKPLWGTRMTYPCKWEFHPAENLSVARKAAR